MRGGHNGFAIEAGFFKYPGQPDHVAAGDHRIDDLGRRRWHQPRARPLNSYMRNLRISSERLISLDACRRDSEHVRHEETAWSIVSAVAVAAGLLMALAIAFGGA